MNYNELLASIDSTMIKTCDDLFVSCEGVDCLILQLENNWVYFTVEEINDKYLLTFRTFNHKIEPKSMTRHKQSSYPDLVFTIVNKINHYLKA